MSTPVIGTAIVGSLGGGGGGGGSVNSVNSGTGISVNNADASNPIVNLADTLVTPGTWGDATHYPILTVDQQGRITLAAQHSITTGAGTVTNVATGAGLSGGPITSTGTIDLRLNASGGLVKNLGGGTNELGIGAGGVSNAMLANSAITINGSPTSLGGSVSVGTVTSVTGGTGLSGGVITGAGTLAVLYGATSSTACVGNDSRLSDDRTASGIRTASTVVSVSAATAPTAGQVLTASSGTLASWVTPTDTGITQLTGDVTAGPGSGSQAATIANGVVTLAKFQNIATASFLGRATAGTGSPEVLSVASAKTLLNLAGSNTGDVTLAGENYLSLASQVLTANPVNLSGSNATGTLAAGRFPALTGDVTTSAGSLATSIANSAVTLAKIANIADQTILGNNSGGAAAPIALTASQTKTVLALNNVENTALSTWPGTTNITTLGTVSTGTWNATAIADGKIASALTGKTYNGLTLTALATGFSVAGGTTSKTLTVPLDATVSGTNTGDQTITLTGNVTGSGTGSFATTIAAAAVTNSMLAGSIAANKLVGTDIATVGTITTGTWNGTTIAVANGGTGQTGFTDGQLLIGSTAGSTLVPATLTAGSGVSIVNGGGTITVSATGSGGTVTSITAGTGLSGGTITGSGTIAIASTGVSATSYGDASHVATFAVNAQGQLTSASNVPIAIANTAVSGLGTLSTQNGTFSGTSSGTNTGDQTITLTGDVTGSGTGSFAATIANGAVSNAKLANSSIVFANGTGILGAATVSLGGTYTPSVDTSVIATRAYVDAVAQSLSIKDSVVALADSNVTITGAPTIDGVSVPNGSRVLLTAQSTGSQNGIWVTAAGAWSRPTDFAAGSHAAGAFTFVEEGTNYASSGWVCTNAPGSDVVDTNNLAFAQFSGAGEITAGTGLTKTGNIISITNTGVSATSYGDASHVATFAVNAQGQLSTAASVAIAIDASAITSGTLGITRGGTGLATVAQGDLLFGSASNVLSSLAKSTSATRYLSNTGTSNNPAWAQVDLTSGVTGVLPVANGGTNSSSALGGNRVMQSSGGAIVEAAAITAARALKSDANGIPVASTATAASLDALSGTNTGDQLYTASGDATAPSSSSTLVLTLATVNGNVGSFGSASSVGTFTVNAKGLVTAAGSTAIAIDTSALTSGTLAAARFPSLTGDVTNSGLTVTIANDAVTTAKILNSNVTLAKIANISDQTILGNNSGGAAAPIALTATQTKTVLSLNNVENTALSTWAGSTNITTLGTIATGVWSATAIADNKIASALTGKTYNGLTLTALATGFSVAGGTTSKTLTVPLDATVSGTNTGDQSFTASGDATAPSSSSNLALTLATVNGNVGTFGSSTSIPTFTVNAKGLITAASGNAVVAPAGTLTGSTLAAGVTASSLTSVGTISSGTWNGTTIAVANGGTGQTSYTDGQLLIGNSTGNTLAKATLTAGTGISITNGSGSITVAATIAGANPSVSVGLSANNGVATTYMRSDASPALSQSITPTWTGAHIFSSDVTLGGNVLTGLTFIREVAHTISVATSTTAATPGAGLSILGAVGNGAQGGGVTIKSGDGNGTNNAAGGMVVDCGVPNGIGAANMFLGITNAKFINSGTRTSTWKHRGTFSVVNTTLLPTSGQDIFTPSPVSTSDATETTQWTLTPLNPNTTYLYEARVNATNDGTGIAGGAGDQATYIVRARIKVSSIGGVTVKPVSTWQDNDNNTSNWSCRFDTDGTSIFFKVTGDTDMDVIWSTTVTSQFNTYL